MSCSPIPSALVVLRSAGIESGTPPENPVSREAFQAAFDGQETT